MSTFKSEGILHKLKKKSNFQLLENSSQFWQHRLHTQGESLGRELALDVIPILGSLFPTFKFLSPLLLLLNNTENLVQTPLLHKKRGPRDFSGSDQSHKTSLVQKWV